MAKLTAEEKALFDDCVTRLNQETAFEELKAYKHHYHTSTYHHSIAVAYFSYKISRWLRWKSNKEKLIYAALLHDYYLYDCHGETCHMHLFKHPNISAENAKRDWNINEIQENIIRRHMFPLTPVPPRYKESMLVSLVDKGCAIYEAVSSRPYHKGILNRYA